jgi:hypothetical protein
VAALVRLAYASPDQTADRHHSAAALGKLRDHLPAPDRGPGCPAAVQIGAGHPRVMRGCPANHPRKKDAY